MPIQLDDTFRFVPNPPTHPAGTARTGRPADDPNAPLGPLHALLQRDGSPATWCGEGFNVIWRPHHATGKHFLELNRTREKTEFSRIPGNIPNRGLRNRDIDMFGVNYLNQIFDVNDGDAGLHFEPGIWAFVEATTDPMEPQTIVRMASIPHGTVVLAQGVALHAPGPPDIPAASITPFSETNPGQTFDFDEAHLDRPVATRTPDDLLAGITQPMLDDPNSVLRDALAPVTVLETTTLFVGTSGQVTPGGGTANTAFLQGIPSSSPPPDANANADADAVTATFWLMRVRTADGEHASWLAYSQRVLLNFGGLSWPHVTVATLVRR